MLILRVPAVYNLLSRPCLASNTVPINKGVASGSFCHNALQRFSHLPGRLFGYNLTNQLGRVFADRFSGFGIYPGFGNEGLVKLASINCRRDCRDLLNRRNRHTLTKRSGSKLNRTYLRQFEKNTVFFSGKINTRLASEPEVFNVIEQRFFTKALPQSYKPRVAGVLYDLQEGLTAMSSSFPAAKRSSAYFYKARIKKCFIFQINLFLF
ncbi:hypothetical protein D3C74_274430 [compost metagenome]